MSNDMDAHAPHPPIFGAGTEEEVAWSSPLGEGASRRARMRARGPYRAHVPLHIAHTRFTLEPSTLLAADDAATEIARFDAETGTELDAFRSVLLRTESASSSQVENLTASAQQIALAEVGASDSANARLIAANGAAMRAALRLAETDGELSSDDMIELHRVLLENDPVGSRFIGRWRDGQVWIGGDSPHSALFVPPRHERVDSLMRDLVLFAARTDLPPLAHIAIAHAQFETIHPFPDGNGRVGRLLAQAMLRRSGLAEHATIPISAGLLRDLTGYFGALTAYREGNANPIVRCFAESSMVAVSGAREFVRRLRAIRRDWGERLRSREGSAARRSLDVLAARPVFSIAMLADDLGVSVTAADRAVQQLLDADIIRPANRAKRGRLWKVPDVLDALEEFSAGMRRPTPR